MPGKIITLRESEYEALKMAKSGFQQAEGKEVDWGRFLLFLLGLYILHEATKPKGERKLK
jgi:hypothetical protein